jgi:hypothetical protein
MKPAHWVPVAAFLATLIPVTLLLGELQLGGDYRVWIGIVVGALATALAQARLAARENGK